MPCTCCRNLAWCVLKGGKEGQEDLESLLLQCPWGCAAPKERGCFSSISLCLFCPNWHGKNSIRRQKPKPLTSAFVVTVALDTKNKNKHTVNLQTQSKKFQNNRKEETSWTMLRWYLDPMGKLLACRVGRAQVLRRFYHPQNASGSAAWVTAFCASTAPDSRHRLQGDKNQMCF